MDWGTKRLKQKFETKISIGKVPKPESCSVQGFQFPMIYWEKGENL